MKWKIEEYKGLDIYVEQVDDIVFFSTQTDFGKIENSDYNHLILEIGIYIDKISGSAGTKVIFDSSFGDAFDKYSLIDIGVMNAITESNTIAVITFVSDDGDVRTTRVPISKVVLANKKNMELFRHISIINAEISKNNNLLIEERTALIERLSKSTL